MTFTHQYETRSHSNNMAGTYESEEESSIDLVPEEKTVNTNATVLRMSNQLLNLFSQSEPKADIQPKANILLKRKEKILDFERHTIDLKIHPYHRFLRLLTTYQVTFFHKLRDVINDDNEGPHWLKFLLQIIAYNDATHKKASDEVVMYKTLARKCKKKIRLSAQHLVDSEKHFIAKEINNENLQTELDDVQTQLTNVRVQCEDNVVTLTEYEQLQQQIENMQSQLENALARRKNNMATNINTTTIATTWRPCSIGLIKLLFDKIVDNYGL